MIIVWHYRDLRLEDHPALTEASKKDQAIISLYIHDPEAERPWQSTGASDWWLHHSLDDLQKRYRQMGSDLILRQGSAQRVFQEILQEISVKEVYWTERFQPAIRQRDAEIKAWLESQGVSVSICEGNYLISPSALLNQSGNPYVVYTPFWKAVDKDPSFGVPLPIPPLKRAPKIASLPLEAFQCLPTIPWDREMREVWRPGRAGAEALLKKFFANRVSDYGVLRDFPGEEGTSRLSPHLAFGEISPREIWTRCQGHPKAEPYLKQLVWREFANYFLYYVPSSSDTSWRREFESFPWQHQSPHLKSWKKGVTGYPIVDAGMRQLWRTGWMHNRVRMIVASFLIKDLMVHWVEGARWFWETLVDFDLANNTLGWQWTAGSGPDAAPYFRIFNPVLQGEKFDPQGDYVKKYVPELSHVPARWIHRPWEAPPSILKDAGVILGKTYPQPVVAHDAARKKALEAYHALKTSY